jgi:class 3 adenylate cyclase/tetratricopeptide (TPR) repeat protein
VKPVQCPNCKQPVSEGARFCPACGTTLGARVDAAERRVVTAIFADLAGSTRLAEQLDPEIVRRIVGEFFQIAGHEIRAHGGAVEQFSGDAAVGVFGMTSSHEDDAERAVRTAFAIVKAMEPLRSLARKQHNVTFDVHIGIESGEAIGGDPYAGGTSVTGDALNVAARLEKSAAPGQILVGPAAYGATKHAIAYEPIGNLTLAGKSLPVAAHQPVRFLAGVGDARRLRDLKAPLLGRDEEMLQLLDSGEHVKQDRTATLFTILGAPGIGKSRLTREAASRLADRGWHVLRGRCLPYGNGITYWPIAEMVRQASGISLEVAAREAIARLIASSPDAAVSDRLAFAIGLTHESPVSGGGIDREIAWAFRRWVRAQAADRPLVLVFEDIHWAEPAILDLIEYLARWTDDAPVLVLCLARPELLDKRPGWGGEPSPSSRIMLQPLSRGMSAALVEALLRVEGLPEKLRGEMLERAGGNPLFVEELIRMLIDEGTIVREGDRWIAAPSAKGVQLPDTVEALIRARLDTLPRAERTALQAGAVIGRSFESSMLEGLLDDRSGLGAVLDHLVGRDLVSEETIVPHSYRFKHILVRDVAYATLAKSRRATLHARVANGLKELPAERSAELVEIRAYHLEQAASLERQLYGSAPDALRGEAVAVLEASCQKALARADYRAAVLFADRCLALGPEPAAHRVEIECLQLEGLVSLGELDRVREAGARVATEAHSLGRKDLEGRGVYAHAVGSWVGDRGAIEALALHRQAYALLSEAEDLPATYDVAFQLGHGGWWFSQMEEAWRWWSECRDIAQRLRDRGREAKAAAYLGGVRYYQGQIEEAMMLRRNAVDLAEAAGSRMNWSIAISVYGFLVALTESWDAGLRLSERAVPALEEAGEAFELLRAIANIALIRELQGPPADAVPTYERALALSQQLAETGFRPELERHLAQVYLEMGDLGAAATHAQRGVDAVAVDDWSSIASTKMALGRVRLKQGRVDDAESLCREAVAIKERTEQLADRWELYLAMAELLISEGRVPEADEWVSKTREIIALYGERSPLAAYVEHRLAALTAIRR